MRNQDFTITLLDGVRVMGHVTAVAALAALLMHAPLHATGPDQAQTQPEPQAQEDDASAPIHVGVYDAQQVFEAYPGRDEGIERLGALAEQAAEAQQAEDEEAFLEMQQRLRAERERIIEDFEVALRDAAAAVAEEAGLDLVAIEVGYHGEAVRTRDITAALIEHWSEQPAEAHEPGEPPQAAPDHSPSNAAQEQTPEQTHEPVEEPPTAEPDTAP